MQLDRGILAAEARASSLPRWRRSGGATLPVLLTILLFVIQTATLVPHGVSLTASSSGSSQLGSPQTITATLADDEGPLANVGVTFRITTGPRTGLGALIYTNPDGRAQWTYTGIGNPGTDTILAQAVVDGAVHSASTTAEWTLPSFGIAGSGSSQLGSPQAVTATLSTNGTPVSDTGVNFRIMSGPREGLGALIYTNPNGQAEWTCTGSGAPGTDVIAGQRRLCRDCPRELHVALVDPADFRPHTGRNHNCPGNATQRPGEAQHQRSPRFRRQRGLRRSRMVLMRARARSFPPALTARLSGLTQGQEAEPIPSKPEWRSPVSRSLLRRLRRGKRLRRG